MTVILGIFMFILVLTCVFMVLIILAQRAKSDGGMGAALGGGMAEAAFGGESANVLQKTTTWAAVLFFVLSFGLYLGFLSYGKNAIAESEEGLPSSPALIQDPGAGGGQGAPDFQTDGLGGGETVPGISFDLPVSEPAPGPADEEPAGEAGGNPESPEAGTQ